MTGLMTDFMSSHILHDFIRIFPGRKSRYNQKLIIQSSIYPPRNLSLGIICKVQEILSILIFRVLARRLAMDWEWGSNFRLKNIAGA